MAAPVERERLDLDAFGDASEDFSPAVWLNARLARNAIPFERLEQNLSSLGMSCQLLCQDTSESIETSASQLVAQLPSTNRELERIRSDGLKGKERFKTVVDGLQQHQSKKGGNKFKALMEVDTVKQRVELAYGALRETGSWERKVRDGQQLVHSGNLPMALSHLAALKEVLQAFRMLEEYPKKEQQLHELEANLLREARRRIKQALDKCDASSLKACCEVFTGLKKADEAGSLSDKFFFELAEKAWQSSSLTSDASAADVAAATRAVLAAAAKGVEDRWDLLQALEELTDVPGGPLASALREALAQLSREREVRFAEAKAAQHVDTDGDTDTAVFAQANVAIALLAAYIDGFEALTSCGPLAKSPELWHEICREGRAGEAVPWALLREVALFVVQRPLEDAAQALVPPVSTSMRPSEAVLAAEANAKKLLQMPAQWARQLEQQGAQPLAVIWLASVDSTVASFWRSWDRLIATFENTLKQKGAADKSYDPALLNECIQLHSMLHDSLPQHFSSFSAEVMQLARTMNSFKESAFSRAVALKLHDPNVWCEFLAGAATPLPALRSAHAALEEREAAALPAQALPASTAALAEAEAKVSSLVIQCCVQPIDIILRAYSESEEFAKPPEATGLPLPGSLLPLQSIRDTGEHLFNLAPQLERPQEPVQQGIQWLPRVIEAVAAIVVQKAMEIKHISAFGAQQLIVDLEYAQRVTDAMGSGTEADAATLSGTAAIELRHMLEVLQFLASEQQRAKEASEKGQPFVPEQPQSADDALRRRFERPLRIALGMQ